MQIPSRTEATASPDPLAAFDDLLERGRFDLAVNVLADVATDCAFGDGALGGMSMPEVDLACRRLAERLDRTHPLPEPSIGFDRVANVYLATEFWQSGGHRQLLLQMIRARPEERHIVVFSGLLDHNTEYSTTVVAEAGALVVRADRSLSRFDLLLWMREKLAAWLPRRVLLFTHPQDVIAHTALLAVEGRMGPRLYHMRHTDTRPALGGDLAGATHLAIRPEQKARLLTERPGLSVHVLPLCFDPAPGRAPATGTKRRIARAKAGARTALLSSRRLMRIGGFVTATCGLDMKFAQDGPVAFGEVVADLLEARSGRHVHLGRVSKAFEKAARDCLVARGVRPDRLTFAGEVGSLTAELRRRGVDLFLGSFPVGGGLSMSEAAYAGVPVALHDPGAEEAGRYISGLTHAPPRHLVWRDRAELRAQVAGLGRVELARMSASSRAWFAEWLAPETFRRHLDTVFREVEAGGATAPSRPERHPDRAAIVGTLFDGAGYLARYPDVGAAGMDPLDHYLRYGEAKGRMPMPLFDAAFYLSQLGTEERRVAAPAPFTHYLLHGQAMGRHPHALFDPEFCALSLGDDGGADGRGMLARYLAAETVVRPHMFFDPAHYARAMPVTLPDGRLLLHFLDAGIAAGIGPHPLIEVDRFGADPASRLSGLVRYLTKPEAEAQEAVPHVLFDPGWFAEKLGHSARGGAPNMLWTHLICGNCSGRDPHPLVQADHVERTRPGTLVSSRPLLLDLAANRVWGDTHPLLSGAHVAAQAPWLPGLGQGATEYFLRSGTSHNIDPHPWFSLPFYLQGNPELLRSGLQPLCHYVRFGAAEGRNPAPFFDGAFYKANSEHPASDTHGLLHYARSGMRHFRPTAPMGKEVRGHALRTARRVFESGIEMDAAGMLEDALHPANAPVHPTLRAETRSLSVDLPATVDATELFAAADVGVTRPAVVSAKHIAPVSGHYTAPAARTAAFDGALVVAGNDGFAAQDGTWCDCGLDGFDAATMALKENGSIVAVSNDGVLLRRHGPEQPIREGILGTGTYSHNYFHFLVEVLPRLMLAATEAPEGVPLLVDGDMPAQHFQALALFLPDRPVRRLTRQFSYRVGRLHVATMPCIVHDAPTSAPIDAVRYHPEALRRIAAMTEGLPRRKTGRRLFLRRDSQRRRLVNGPEIEAALRKRGFEILDCARMTFAEQVIAIAGAEIVVAQSGAHLANLVFARPGTRAVVLYSNVAGTNYYLWSGLGDILGLRVFNVVGWRVVGSAPGRDQDLHENFSVPLDLLLPLLPGDDAERMPDDLTGVLDRLYGANGEADAITGAWNLLADETPPGFEDRLVALRGRAATLLEEAAADTLDDALAHPFFADFGRNVRSGFAALPALEAAGATRAKTAFAALAEGATVDPAEARRTLARAMLLLAPQDVPLIADVVALPDDVARRYLSWLGTPPFLFRAGADAAYGAHVERLLDWIADQLGEPLPEGRKIEIARMAATLDLGLLLIMDQPLKGIARARNRVLEHLACRDLPAINAPGDAVAQGRRVRIGIICRTFAKGPDSEAIVAMFHAFDKARVEIFAYTVGFRDRVVKADTDFDRRFDAVIDHRRHLNADPVRLRDQLAEDGLDVLLYANATTYGIGPLDLAMYRRIAPLQIVMNSHVPMSLGFPSFDAYLTGRSDRPDREVDQADYAERLLRVQGPVINYLDTFKPRETVVLDRAALGIAAEDVVLMNAGSLTKLRHDCLHTMLRALCEVPKGLLLLAPYNPGWVARSQAFAFNRQLREAAAEVGAPMERIRVLGEMSVAEAESALALCDIYLNPFPHGGATMTHLALINGKPPVTIRRRSTRSIDQFLTDTMGFGELLVDTPDDYVALVRDLGRDPARRADLSRRMAEAAKSPGFVCDPDWSRAMQAAILGAFEGLLDPSRDTHDTGARSGDGSGDEGLR